MTLLSKEDFRQEIKEKLQKLSPSERLQRSTQVLHRLCHLLHELSARTLMLYAALPDEVQTDELMRWWLSRGGVLVLPRIQRLEKRLEPRRVSNLEDDLEVADLAILAPKATCQLVELEDIDVVIAPGRAFDERCFRLGRGSGYYDRFLKLLPSQTLKGGLAFSFQIVPELPIQPNDVPMDFVVTEDRTLWRPR